jgi:hypothetical protein
MAEILIFAACTYAALILGRAVTRAVEALTGAVAVAYRNRTLTRVRASKR